MLPRVLQTVAAWMDVLTQALYPPRCLHCLTMNYGSPRRWLCPACMEDIEWIGSGACTCCGMPAGPHATLGKGCSRCSPSAISFTRAVACARYGGGLRDGIHALKYHGQRWLAKDFSLWIAQRALELSLPACDWIVPVPLHPSRQRDRGYNQSELIACHVAKAVGKPCRLDVLRRIRPTEPQASLSHARRIRNLEGAFVASSALPPVTVWLIDDVLTTGTTANECARVLRSSGIRHLYVLTIAR